MFRDFGRDGFGPAALDRDQDEIASGKGRSGIDRETDPVGSQIERGSGEVGEMEAVGRKFADHPLAAEQDDFAARGGKQSADEAADASGTGNGDAMQLHDMDHGPMGKPLTSGPEILRRAAMTCPASSSTRSCSAAWRWWRNMDSAARWRRR